MSETIACVECGCKGNCDCGHEPFDKENFCTLDVYDHVCPCCVMIYRSKAYQNLKSHPLSEAEVEGAIRKIQGAKHLDTGLFNAEVRSIIKSLLQHTKKGG